MKYFAFILILISNYTSAQDCKTLDNFTSFHGIKFGKSLPDSLRKYYYVHFDESGADSMFLLDEDKATQNFIKKISDWLNVKLSFSDLVFFSLKDGRIYSIMLQHNLSKDDSISLSKKEYPLFFSAVTDELVATFGKITKEETNKDFFTIIDRKWECHTMLIEFSIYFDNLYSLTFTNKELDKERHILKYK